MTRKTFPLSLLITLSLVGVAAACPACKDSIPNSDAQSATGVPAGFNYSIYYMLAGLFTVGGLVIRMIVKEVRTTDERR